jgi:hypothetical protein
MVVVVGSGVLGRYILVFVPKTLRGGELDQKTVRRRLVVYRRKLMALGVQESLLGTSEPITSSASRSPWPLQALAGVFYGDRESRHEIRRLSAAVSADASLDSQARSILILMRKLSRERQWLVRYSELRRLIGTWRFLHRWLAVMMFMAVFFHVLVAVRFGDLWILGGGD